MSEPRDIQTELIFLKQELERVNCELERTTQEKKLSALYGLEVLKEKGDLEQRCKELETLNDTLRTELELLREQDVEKLTCKLETATQEKNLSALYGLQILKEKEHFEQRCQESDTLNDTLQTELELLREALAKYQINQKVTASSGIEQEENLLLETASKEASLTSTALEFAKELKQVRKELSCIGREKERILQENIDLSKNCDVKEWEKRTYKAELKELKLREACLLSDNNELETENISLQKQISSLRSSQVEFEGAKHEVCCLQEEIEAAKGQVDELISLKRIAEKQLKEALEALQSEREQKYALRKELDQRMNSESIFNINNLGFSGLGLENLNQGDVERSVEEGDNDTTLTSLSLSAIYENENVVKPQSSTVGDLFSEVHLSEIHRLERQLEVAEHDNASLKNRLQITQQQMAKTESELTRLQRMVEHINELIDLLGKLGEKEYGSNVEDPEIDTPEMSRLKNLLSSHKQRCQKDVEELEKLRLAVLEIRQTQNDVQVQQQRAVLNKEKVIEKLNNQISELKIQVQTSSNKIKDLEDDLISLGEIAKEARFALNFTKDDLVAISKELAQLYHHVCMVNGETPNRVMLDHVKGSHISETGSKSETLEDAKDQPYSSLFSINASKLDTLKEKLKSDVAIKILLEEDKNENRSVLVTPSNHLLDAIRDQLRHLAKAVENTIEIYHQKSLHSGNEDHSSFDEVEDSREQVILLKTLLARKQEEIASLSIVLKANKQTAEVAMENLKRKYVIEKAIVSETLKKLRNEVRLLRENKATFDSLIVTLAAQYVEQLDEKQRQLTSSDEYIEVLYSVLKLVIMQKLELIKKLEEYEMDSDASTYKGSRHSDDSPPHHGQGETSQQMDKEDPHSKWTRRNLTADFTHPVETMCIQGEAAPVLIILVQMLMEETDTVMILIPIMSPRSYLDIFIESI